VEGARMPVVVLLSDVVGAMDLPNDEWTSYLNLKTGEIVTVTDEDRQLAEHEERDETHLSDWQRESLNKAREALAESGDFVALPDRFEIDEWSIMERFATSLAGVEWRGELMDAIRDKGAFRLFRSTVRRLGIQDDWYRFRQAEFEAIAKAWLEAHDIAFR
jgi:hypothetical protein